MEPNQKANLQFKEGNHLLKGQHWSLIILRWILFVLWFWGSGLIWRKLSPFWKGWKMWSCWLLGCVIEWATYHIRMLLVLNKALLGKWSWRFSEREIIYVEKSLRENMGKWRRIPVQRRLERSMDRVFEKPSASFMIDSRFLWGSSGRSTNFLTENDVGRNLWKTNSQFCSTCTKIPGWRMLGDGKQA